MSSLFAEVRTGAAEGFGLGGGYFLEVTAVRQRSVACRKGPASARLPNRPGQSIPEGQSPLPASSQKPGNREGNQRIPYARFMYTWPADSAQPRDIVDGDVVFVHKSRGAMGNGANRLVKSTGIPQLNTLLSDSIPAYHPGSGGDGLGSEFERCVRRMHWLLTTRRCMPRCAVADYYWRIYQQQLAAPDVADLKDVDVYRDWRAVITLSDWTVDGVLISMDDDELDVQTHIDGRHDGVLLNVCVQGPTPVRNSKWHLEQATVDRDLIRKNIGNDSSACGLQVIDNGI